MKSIDLFAIHFVDDHAILCEDRFQGLEVHSRGIAPVDRCYACDDPIRNENEIPSSHTFQEKGCEHFHLCSPCAEALGQRPNDL